jgi:hypothetical protein
MSDMLEQAIVDAKALREAAVKSAEVELLDKYADEMKSAVTKLLEAEDDLGLGGFGEEEPVGAPEGGPEAAPPSFADGERLCPCPEDGQEIEVDFAELRADIEAEEEAGDAEGVGLGGLGGEDELGLGGEDELGLGDEEEEDDLALEENIISALKELTSDISEDVLLDLIKPAELQEEEEAEEAPEEEESDEAQSAVAMDALKAGYAKKEESLNREVSDISKQLGMMKKRNTNYKNVIDKMTSRLAEVNLSNAKLLYTNRVLNNASLNERQKKTIVESISNSGSVEEAKTIFNTLQSAVSGQSSAKRSTPNTLSEAVRRSASPFALRNHKESKQTDAFSERMQKLAGIKN